MIDAELIMELYKERRRQRGPLLAKMEEIREAYNGDIVLAMPQMDSSDQSIVANLVTTGLDQSAMRIASTQPNVWYPPDNATSETSQKISRTRREVTLAWYHENRMKLMLRRRARWFIGYACAPVVVRPDFQKRIPVWDIRDPLSTYPAPCQNHDELTPPDCIFTYHRSMSWVMRAYPDQYQRLRNPEGKLPGRDDVVQFLEYFDDQERVLCAIGRSPDSWHLSDHDSICIELERAANRTGRCWVVVPGRITLDRAQGQYDQVIGMYKQQARLAALQMIATEKGIFADTYLVSRPGETATFIAGPYDGRTGKVNIVSGGDIKETNTNAGFQTSPLNDRLERAMRLTGGIPQEFGGESGSNIRTGRRGDSVLSAIVDFPIQEAQEVFQFSMQEENCRAIAIDKTYFDTPKTFYVSWRGAKKGKIDYTPSKVFAADTNFVTFAHAGADINGLVVGLGQRIGIGLMSTRTGMEIDPMVEDPELEHDRITTEGLEKALLTQLQTLASQPGGMPIEDLAYIMQAVKSDKMDLAEAVVEAQKRAQDRQASMDAEGNPTAVDPNSPEAQPGMNVPGQGAEAGAAIPEPGQGQKNLSMLLNELRGTRQSMQVPA